VKRAARWALRQLRFAAGLAVLSAALILVLAFGDADDLFGDSL